MKKSILALTLWALFSCAALAQTPPANSVWAGPTAGGEGFPSWRPLVNADVPGTLTSKTIAGASNSINLGAVGGRLTLTTGTPVLTATVSGATTVYFTPYKGNQIPVTTDGTNFFYTTFSELSQTTSDTTKSPAAVGASSLYDIFVWNDSGTLRATRGPAWSSGTSRGSGAGTTQLSLLSNGLYVNTVAITNGPGANKGTYVGSIASNGSSTIDFILGGSASGGTAGVLNVWNNYNRVNIYAATTDNGTTYTYSSATVREARGSTTNQITFLSGLAEDAPQVNFHTDTTTAAVSGTQYYVGAVLDVTNSLLPAGSLPVYFEISTVAAVALHYGHAGGGPVPPQLGQHFVARVERSDGSNNQTFDVGTADYIALTFQM